jgi:hypothetical protein
MAEFENPFRPGAGHRPPYLAGRQQEKHEFAELLSQSVITDNLLLTGLRGVGKTVLLDELKPQALGAGWLWVGTDMSEAASISEKNIARRLIIDLSVVTENIKVGEAEQPRLGFLAKVRLEDVTLSYDFLMDVYERTPGLVIDKIKNVFEIVEYYVRQSQKRGIVFAYDEAQNLSDQAMKQEYPMSIVLDLFQSLQRKRARFLLVLSGLPTLFPKLVEARTYSERMFRVLFLKQLSKPETRDAIEKPLQDTDCPVRFRPTAIDLIYEYSGGYPYFIQFICRELFDSYLNQTADGKAPSVPITAIIRKLDTDFFAGRWSRATDRQQQLLFVIANIGDHNNEFTVQEIAKRASEFLENPFGRSHINQLLSSMITAGLVYRDRHGKYLFAVPMMADFIRRNFEGAGRVR